MGGVDDQTRHLIQEAPVLIRELVDALKRLQFPFLGEGEGKAK